ncbi:MAG: hypothetical protein RLZZ59_462 [Pseudomonadota bacterium]|jgi:hypothetical protein
MGNKISGISDYMISIKNADIPAVQAYINDFKGLNAIDLVSMNGENSPLLFAASKLINELSEVFKQGEAARPLTFNGFGKYVSQIIEIYLMIRSHINEEFSGFKVMDFINPIIERKKAQSQDLASVELNVREFFISLENRDYYSKIEDGWKISLPGFFLDSDFHLIHIDSTHAANSFILKHDGMVALVAEHHEDDTPF